MCNPSANQTSLYSLRRRLVASLTPVPGHRGCGRLSEAKQKLVITMANVCKKKKTTPTISWIVHQGGDGLAVATRCHWCPWTSSQGGAEGASLGIPHCADVARSFQEHGFTL